MTIAIAIIVAAVVITIGFRLTDVRMPLWVIAIAAVGMITVNRGPAVLESIKAESATRAIENAKAEERYEASEKRRRETIAWQERDIALCREKGGVPIVRQSDITAWGISLGSQLSRCDFPANTVHVGTLR